MAERTTEDLRALARELYAVFNREGVEGMRAKAWDPEIVWDEGSVFPDAEKLVGADLAAARLADRLSVAGVGLELIDFTPTSPNGGLAELGLRGLSASGVPLDFHWWQLVRVGEDDRVTEVVEFIDGGEARQAAGLE